MAAGVIIDVAKRAKAADADRLRAATAILDRAGLGPQTKTELSGPGGGPIELARVVAEATAGLEDADFERARALAADLRERAGEAKASSSEQ